MYCDEKLFLMYFCIMVTGHILFIMTQITNKTVRFNFMLHSPSEEASSSTLAPLFLVSGLLSLEVKHPLYILAKYVAIRWVFLSRSSLSLFEIKPPPPPFHALLMTCKKNRKFFFLLIGWIPAVCGSVLSAGGPCGPSRE